MSEKRIESIIVNGPVLANADRGLTAREMPLINLQDYLDMNCPALSSCQVARISRYVDLHFVPKKISTRPNRKKRHSAA